MTEIRPIRENEVSAAVELADLVFRDSEHSSMGHAFPLVFTAGLGPSHGAFVNGKLVAFMGLVPAVVRVAGARVKAYQLGAVCTHPEERGKGHAGDILNKMLEHMSGTDASLLLVSGDRPLYERAHCYLYGNMRRYTITAEQASKLLAGAEGAELRDLEAADWFELLGVAESRSSGFEQSVSELASMIRSEAYASCVKLKQVVRVAVRDGRIAAFAALAVPKGLETSKVPFTVEWGGDARLAAALLGDAASRYELAQLHCVVPSHETAMNALLTAAAVPFADEKNYGTVRVLDAGRLLTQLQPYLQELGVSFRGTPEEGGELRVGEHTVALDPRQLVSLLFDAEPTVELAPAVKEQLAGRFPLPFPYVAGLNYV